MKIRIYCSDGGPVDPAHRVKRLARINSEHDKLVDAFGKCDSSNSHLFEEKLKQVDKDNLSDYPIFQFIDYPTTPHQFRKLFDKFGAIVMCVEEGQIIAYCYPIQAGE